MAVERIFDKLYLKKLLSKFYNLDLPDYQNRNRDSQYWIFWPREAASKGIEKGTRYEWVKDWDSAFNLTASYRRDSDILR